MLRFRNENSLTLRFEYDFGESEWFATRQLWLLTSNLQVATLIWCRLVYLRERENGQETDPGFVLPIHKRRTIASGWSVPDSREFNLQMVMVGRPVCSRESAPRNVLAIAIAAQRNGYNISSSWRYYAVQYRDWARGTSLLPDPTGSAAPSSDHWNDAFFRSSTMLYVKTWPY